MLILLEVEVLWNSFKVRLICGGVIFGLIIDQHGYILLSSLHFLLNHLSGQRLHTSTYIYQQQIPTNCKKNKNNYGHKGTIESIHGVPGLIMKADPSDSLSLL